MALQFFYEADGSQLIQEETIRYWLNKVAEKEGFVIDELNYIFVTDNYLLQINREYLQHDYLTDIITFDYVENHQVKGDIFISIDRVKDNAQDFQVSTTEELNRVMVHGLLHLMGYNDHSDKQKAEMRKKEDSYLAIYP